MDDAPIVTLHSAPPPEPAVVKMLEEVLERAREGEIHAVGIAAVTTGRADATVFEIGECDIAHLHLAASRLVRRLEQVGED